MGERKKPAVKLAIFAEYFQHDDPVGLERPTHTVGL
jgi:hypothetical protein